MLASPAAGCARWLALHFRRDLVHRGARNRILADDRDRSRLAAADAGRVQHAHAVAEQRRQPLEQVVRAGELARNRVAHADGDRRRRGVAFLHDVEVVIERRHLVHLGHRHLQLGGERDEVRRGQVAVAVLNLVEVLDQQIAPPRRVAEQLQHLLERAWIDAASLRRGADTSALALRPWRPTSWRRVRLETGWLIGLWSRLLESPRNRRDSRAWRGECLAAPPH